ncbi:unnamed protein product [Rotaria magnacalcarata]|uniref:G domain-containing protein n=2 Tax=Rotaria magnacalcarata TaxID=392030 RepID=A0A816PW55_9BILA|nr:unnamed protein product [Rotaria magnacalcarata]
MHENDTVLPSCCSDLAVTAACLSSPFIQRRAVGSPGQIGWLYDAINDQIIANTKILNDSTDKRSNLLKWCDTEDELRLSVALQICESKGIGEIINYSGSINEYTRFLYYTYHQKTEHLKDEVLTSSNTNKPQKLVIDATHTIVLVNFGIEAIVVLQLPPDDEHVPTIDHALEQLCSVLKGDQQSVRLSDEHKESLEKILQIKVFSNTTELSRVKSVLDLHPEIQSSLKNGHLIKPLNYNLYPINYIYHTKDENKYAFTELKREGNPQLNLIYVDFSYVSYKLNDFIILPTTEIISNLDETQQSTTPKSERSKSVEPINILLLGESGVGKSTFINAFVNYLKFHHLKRAEKNPIVLIPVSFTITVDDDFTERVVKYEREDSLNNENHDGLGKSITQHCKSYVFILQDGENRGQKLRIIDTPGIGDTEGLNQDDKNMQHVLSYINNLTHLNAICILLKPNNSRLTVFFRSCFTQLIDMLSENICDRIIFCFTNSRSTFYTPGNTGPVLKALIDSLPVKQIRFAKENTFCFDSESFRYLVAKLNRIKFNSMEEADYNSSWEKSMTELNRFIGYIRSNMADPIILNESHSVKHAQLMANSMIRPMLEAMRNTIRNIILLNERSHKTSIELCPKIIKGTTAICLECPRKCIKICDFWVAIDGLHVVQNKCRTCLCDPSQHYRIDYELEYKEIENSAKPTEEDMKKLLHSLYEASPKFGYFLLQSVGNSQRDPFLLGFERMIKEESDICDQKTSYKFNLDLVEQLQVLKNSYEKEKKKLDAKKMTIELDDIYQKIENVNKHRIIDLQMNAIRQWHKFMVKYYESDVPISKEIQ